MNRYVQGVEALCTSMAHFSQAKQRLFDDFRIVVSAAVHYRQIALATKTCVPCQTNRGSCVMHTGLGVEALRELDKSVDALLVEVPTGERQRAPTQKTLASRKKK